MALITLASRHFLSIRGYSHVRRRGRELGDVSTSPAWTACLLGTQQRDGPHTATNGHLLNLDVATCGSRIWFCLPLLLPSHTRVTAAIPQLKLWKQPPPPHFLSFLVYNTAPASLEAAPWRQTKHSQEWASSLCADVSPSGLLCLFTVSPTNPPPPFLPSSLKDLPPRSLWKGSRASAVQSRLFDFLQCHRFSISACGSPTDTTSISSSTGARPLQVPAESPFILVLNTSLWNHKTTNC